MNAQEINDILSCLQDDNQPYKGCYYHYEHAHVHLLVSRWLQQFNDAPFHKETGRVATVADFKTSKYARWQHTPVIKQWLASHAGRHAVLTPLPHIGLVDSKAKPMGYAITLGKWGSEDKSDYLWWNQTSRLGYNLVVQLNLPLDVLRTYQAMKVDDPVENCQMTCHPVHEKRLTLAWARLDIDLANSQVLIEEIQSDWIGELTWSLKDATKNYCDECCQYNCDKHQGIFHYYGSPIRTKHYIDTMQKYHKQYKNTWANMILTATLDFIWRELGRDIHVFYHQYDFGCALKGCEPPKSLYSAVPEKLGFKITEEFPQMLMDNKLTQKKLNNIKRNQKQVDMRFYRLA